MSELFVGSGEQLKQVTGSIIDETEMEVNAGDLLLILMLPILCDTKGCPKQGPCWFCFGEVQVSLMLRLSLVKWETLKVSETQFEFS